ncbi:hypothetical protein WMY93_010659 [Mugilogobius chulae]|uniref:ORM1-like protein 3 n=3 Tax=Gobiidae TaxID=8220 RepID=A0AAW0P968_9GOBI
MSCSDHREECELRAALSWTLGRDGIHCTRKQGASGQRDTRRKSPLISTFFRGATNTMPSHSPLLALNHCWDNEGTPFTPLHLPDPQTDTSFIEILWSSNPQLPPGPIMDSPRQPFPVRISSSLCPYVKRGRSSVLPTHRNMIGRRSSHASIMNVGTAHSEVNPNTRVMNSRGIWLSYILGIGLLHVILLSIPFASVPVVWTLTNLIHNLCMYLLLHTVKGTPFETPDQGKARLLTHWEQMDYGVQFTASRKFLTITPIVLYILTSFYTKYDQAHFVVNTVSLLTVLIPKLPQLHGVRIFGINKY